MSDPITLNGVKVSFKPKDSNANAKKRTPQSADKKKRVYFDKDSSKPSKPYKKFDRSQAPKRKDFGGKNNAQKKDDAFNVKLLTNGRYCAIDIIYKIEKGQSLSELLVTELQQLSDNDKRFVQHLVYGALRQFEILESQLTQYLQTPIKPSERQVSIALLLAMYEITEMNTAQYAAVNNWVDLIRFMGKEWAVGLTNGILRKVLREGLKPLSKNLVETSLPQWLSKLLVNYWGRERGNLIAEHFLTHPQMTIRVNAQQASLSQYSELLNEKNIEHTEHQFVDSAIVLKHAVSVAELPSFMVGMSSVQDASAQIAAQLLSPADNEVIIDACAAPGGKTIALLEHNNHLQVIYAIDSVEKRLERVKENVVRVFPNELAQKVALMASPFEQFKLDEKVDAILLDVPCSATGIIHRHPDIKRLRQSSDIQSLVSAQAELLNHAWTLLKDGGRLLYATCSILKDENEKQMISFFDQHANAKEIELTLPFAQREIHGYQILPIYNELSEKMDGFYYCLIQKNHA